MDDITELIDLIYAREKVVSDKLVIPQRNPNRNLSSWLMAVEYTDCISA